MLKLGELLWGLLAPHLWGGWAGDRRHPAELGVLLKVHSPHCARGRGPALKLKTVGCLYVHPSWGTWETLECPQPIPQKPG